MMNGDQIKNDHRAAMRRSSARDLSVSVHDAGAADVAAYLHFGPFRLGVAERQVLRDGVPVPIGGRAFDLLVVLTQRAGEVIGARDLLRLVWPDVVVEEANLRVCIATLRKALGESRRQPSYIVNVAGRGYTFAAVIGRAPAGHSGPIEISRTVRVRPQWSPAHLLISCNGTLDMLSRLRASPRFVRLAGAGTGASHTTAAETLAIALREECGNDAACFAYPGKSGAQTAVPADPRIVIVLDRCLHLVEMAASLSRRLLRGEASVHFLAANVDALRVEQEILPALSPAGDPARETVSLIEGLKAIGVAAMPYPHWRKKYGGLTSDAMKRLQDLERENERLRRAVSDLTLEKLILQETSPGHL